MRVTGSIHLVGHAEELSCSLADGLAACCPDSPVSQNPLDWERVIDSLQDMGVVFRKVDHKQQMQHVTEYIQENLKAACKEIQQWRDTSVLPPLGHVRIISDMLRVITEDRLRVAEALIERAAIDRVANS